LIGCGCYADSEAGGASSTGYGEAIMKVVMAKAAVDMLRGESSSMQVAQETIALFAKRTQASAGLILLDRDGNPGFAFNTPRMAYGYVAPDGSFVTVV
jgi:beta-aspartyl-peptidase (threonine type)